jgi:NADH-quinone oxidoreductase subunit J
MAETVVFVVFAVAALAGAVTMLWARNPVFAAMGLLLAMFSVAVFYILLDAHFVAAVQVIIYAGAVMTLFLFVIMLIGVDRSEDHAEQIPLQRTITIVLAAGLFAVIAVSGRAAWVTGTVVIGEGAKGTIGNIADDLFGTWTIPFLATVFLLTIAAVGTVALAHFGPGGLAADEEGSG